MSLITPGMLKGMFPRTYGAIEGLRAYIDGLPLGTVTKTLSRAYSLLRQELQARASVQNRED